MASRGGAACDVNGAGSPRRDGASCCPKPYRRYGTAVNRGHLAWPLPGQVLDDAELVRLGFRPADRADLLAHAARLEDDDHVRVAEAAAWLTRRVGDLGYPWPRVFPGLPDETGRPMGLLPLLALVASAGAVRRFHAARGVPPDVSDSGLRDLGQQVWVHRRTYGEFGLHTQGWLVGVWSGAYFWLGRLPSTWSGARAGG